MVNPVQPIGTGTVQPTRIEPAVDRASLASGAVTGPAGPPPPSPPAAIVQLSDAVFARQRGVVPGRTRHDWRGERLFSETSARAKAEGASQAVRTNAALAASAQAHLPAERVYGLLLFD